MNEDVKYNNVAVEAGGLHGDNPFARAALPRGPLAENHASKAPDISADASWFSRESRPADHADAVATVVSRAAQILRRPLRSQRAIFAEPIPISPPVNGVSWPMDADEPPPFPPPWPSSDVRARMEAESSGSHPESDLGPLAAQWVGELQSWYARLQAHFAFDPSNLPANLRNNIGKWRVRLEYLRASEPELLDEIMANIERGHVIPFGGKTPDKFFRRRNPPSLALDKERAWAAIIKDMAHGALAPVNLKRDGVPTCVCPVRTAEKNDGTARFVHNSRRVNKCVPKSASACELESLLRTRNMYIPGGFLVGLDFGECIQSCMHVCATHRCHHACGLARACVHLIHLPTCVCM